jgi:hypothetical protein
MSKCIEQQVLQLGMCLWVSEVTSPAPTAPILSMIILANVHDTLPNSKLASDRAESGIHCIKADSMLSFD